MDGKNVAEARIDKTSKFTDTLNKLDIKLGTSGLRADDQRKLMEIAEKSALAHQ